MSQLGPIAQKLEEEIKRDLRNQGLIIWLDKDAHYSNYVDQLIDRHARNDFFAPVIAFRGSYLQLLFDLEAYGNGLDPDRLLIHMPGHTEETIRKTPILELYKPGKRFRKALPTLIREAATGRLSPNEVEAYLANNLSTLASAETWFAEAIDQRRVRNQGNSQNNSNNKPSNDLENYLTGLSLEWILEGALGLHPEFQQRVNYPELISGFIDYLNRQTSFSAPFRKFYLGLKPEDSEPQSLAPIAEAFTAWVMCVEYVHDLQREPHLEVLQPLTKLSAPIRQTCLGLVKHLRDKHPKTYRQLALRVEGLLSEEINAVKAEDLGNIDTFRWEENKILDSALTALANTHWQAVLNASTPRIENKSFWLSQDSERAQEWSLIHNAALLGTSLRDAPDPLAASLDLNDAIAAYTETAYRVDQAHRQFEQQRAKLLDSALPHFSNLLTAAEALRGEYRTWADRLCDRFCQLCQDQGFLPVANLQQRQLFDQVVAPLTKTHGGSKPTQVAYFLIDAFRYEMAAELLSQLEGQTKNNGIQVHLNARYAELPTITAVGMNLLAPVHSGGKLTVASTGKKFGGFKAGEYTVKDPKTRERAMGDRGVGKHGTVMLKLDEVSGFESKTLKKKCDKAQLIVVHSKEIDDAGEANVGPLAFAELLKQIKSACNRLRAIGIGEFVLTADHGFLLQEETFSSVDQGTKKTPERRYAFSPNPEQSGNKLSVSLNSLGYQGKDEVKEGYLIFLRSTEVFTTSTKGAKFVHGGNSLQERVIPVLTLSTKKQAPLSLASYRLDMKALASVMKMQRLQVSLKSAPGILDFTNSSAKISLGLRVRDRSDIQVRIKDVASAEFVNQQVLLLPNHDEPAEIFFDLTGPYDERVQIEAYHPDGLEDVEVCVSQEFFPVAGAPPEKKEDNQQTVDDTAAAPKLPPANHYWVDNFEDESLQRVFRHLEDHGSVNEAELTQMLGSPRKVRRFAKQFDEYLLKIPFTVHIEATASGKRYVRD